MLNFISKIIYLITLLKGTFQIPISLSNIPPNLQILQSYEEIITYLANTTTSYCKSSVLFNPQTSTYYFRNPNSYTPNNIKSYLKMKCRKIPYHFQQNPKIQKFYFTFTDIEEIINNNDDSIFQVGVQEITDIQKGFEMSLFPVKFYKKEDNTVYTNNYSFLCYDSFKVLGIDNNYNDYFILSARSIYDIIHCDTYDQKKGLNYINNLIRYSEYCDEFCREDLIYFSNDLIKCKCDFGNMNLNNNIGSSYSGNNYNEEKYISNVEMRINKKKDYGIGFNNKINEILFDFSSLFHMIMILFSCQILYLFFFFEKKKYLFLKTTIFFYLGILLFFITVNYLCQIKFLSPFSYETFVIISKCFTSLYPVIIILFSVLINNKDAINLTSVTLLINSLNYFLIYDSPFIFLVHILFLGTIICFSLNYTEEKNINNYVKIYIVSSKIKLFIYLIQNLSLMFIEEKKFYNLFSGVFLILSNSEKNHHFIFSYDSLFKLNYMNLISFHKKKSITMNGNVFINIINTRNFRGLFFLFNIIRYNILIYIIYIFEAKSNGIAYIFNAILNLEFFKIAQFFLQMSLKIIKGNSSNISIKNKNFAQNMIFCIFIIHQIFIAKECFYFFIIHFTLGFISYLLMNDTDSDNKGMIRRVFSSSINLRRDNGIEQEEE